MRSVLSVIALTLGILGVVTVASANAVLADTVAQRALMIGGNVATFRAVVEGANNLDELTRYGRLLQARTHASTVAPQIALGEYLTAADGADSVQLDVLAVTAEYRSTFPLVVVSGVWMHETSTLAPRVVVNERAAAQLHSPTIQISSPHDKFRVVRTGVVADGAQTPRVYMPVTKEFDFNGRTVSLLFTGASLTRDTITAASAELSTLHVDMKVAELERLDTVSQLEHEIAATNRVLISLGTISLISTVFATINLGLATSKARSREFALRRVIGASRRQITMVTLLESQIIAGIAATFAFALSWAFFPVIISSFNTPLGITPPSFSPGTASISFAVSSVSALLASLVPAVLSFRRDFSQVMRY